LYSAINYRPTYRTVSTFWQRMTAFQWNLGLSLKAPTPNRKDARFTFHSRRAVQTSIADLQFLFMKAMTIVWYRPISWCYGDRLAHGMESFIMATIDFGDSGCLTHAHRPTQSQNKKRPANADCTAARRVWNGKPARPSYRSRCL